MMSFVVALPTRAANVPLNLYGSASLGWGTTASSESNPAPTLTVQQGDVVTIALTSTDGFPHQLLIDLNGNGMADPGEPVSAQFTTTTTLTFTASQAGTFAYLCEIHPASMHGTFVIQGSGSSPAPPSGAPAGVSSALILLGATIVVVVVAGISVIVLRSRQKAR